MKRNIFLYFMLSCAATSLRADSIATVINFPGSYSLGDNMIASPTDSNDAAIIIAASGVVLNMGQYTITQANGIPGFNGVVVQPGFEGVKIVGGNIIDLTGNGIIVGDGCLNISIEDVFIDDCMAGGLLLDGNVSGTGINNVLIQNCVAISCTGVGGGPGYGFNSVATSSLTFNNCTANNNDAVTTSSGYGFMATSCDNFEFVDCNASDNGGDTEAAGFYISNSTNLFLTRCDAYGSIGRSTSATTTSYGIFLDQCSQSLITECNSISNIQLQGGNVVGLCAKSGSKNIINSCLCETNTGKNSSSGFNLDAETQSYIDNSVSRHNISQGKAYGIWLNNGSTKCTVKNSTIEHNLGDVASFGIEDSASNSTSVIIANYAFNNGTNYNVNFTVLGLSLPILSASLSLAIPGLPSGVAGVLDNISVNP